jgi:nitroreductase
MSSVKKPAETSVPIHDLIRHRWSPRAFDPRPVEPERLRTLFEAARWAPSSYNAQPWYFIVGTKDDPENYNRVLETFVEFNQGWAKQAPVLALSVAKLTFDDGKPNRHAFHDVGQAAANLTIQAEALGLSVHQMAGIEPEKARKLFHIPADYEAVAGIALGYAGDPSSLGDEMRKRELAPRQRKPLDSFVFTGEWGHVPHLVKPKRA